MIFEIEEDLEKERQLIEESRQESTKEVLRIYQKLLDDRKNGIHKTFAEHMEELYYDSLTFEDKIYYDMKRGLL